MQRRDAMKKTAGILALALGGELLFSRYANAKPILKLRPPAALDERDFITHCIRCGLCVKACPYDTLSLANFSDKGIENGTPFFVPRKIPCYMCVDIPCVDACPTGALDPQKVKTDGKFDINKSKMGVAVIDEKHCVAFFGIQCDACYRACPLLDRAIFIDYKKNERTDKHAKLLPIVDNDYCTGCGKCENACITQKSAITVVPRDLIIGEINDNYVRGWIKNDDEKLKNSDTKIKLNEKKSLDYLNGGEL